VIVASELEPVSQRLANALGLGEPYSDRGVSVFGLENAVFALDDTFLEVVTPIQPDTAAGRWLARRGGDCGYMVMFEVGDLPAARRRARDRHVREVFEVDLDDIAEVHLHPSDMGGAIVALSAPRPPGSWRWAGPDWHRRRSPLGLGVVTVAVPDPAATAEHWSEVLGAPVESAGVRFTRRQPAAGVVEIAIASLDGVPRASVDLGGVRISCRRPADPQGACAADAAKLRP
jgi:hypothetical protein